MTSSEKAAAKAPRPLPPFIVLLADRGPYLAGKVLAADADLISALDTEGAKYRAATATEVSIAGL